MIGRWSAWLGFAVTVAMTGMVHARMDATPRGLEGGESWVMMPEVAELVSLGFDAVVADFHWLRAVQIAGEDDVDPVQHAPVLGRLVDVVTHLDPWVDHPYRFAAIWMTDSEESVRHANRLLERGIAHHPDDWRMYFYRGFNEFYYLEDPEEAAGWLAQASERPGSPLYLPRLVARLRSESESLEVAALFLQQLVRDAPDEYARAEYQGALDEIEIERAARFLERARQAYRELAARDIERVEDLLIGPHAVLRSLPPAMPSSLPRGLRRGSRWELDPESGRIQSSYYGRRYEVNFHPMERERQEMWREERRRAAARSGEESEG